MSISEIANDHAFAIQFPRAGDRFANSIAWCGELIAASVEGGGDEDWPASPPLQQLSIEDLGNGPVGLLVGMAGHSHWSLSVETRDREVAFDAACRIKGRAEQLGSTYQLGDDVTALPTPEGLVIQRSGTQLLWSIDQGAEFAQAELHWSANDSTLAIRVTADAAEGATVRWRYRLSALLSD